MGLLNIISDALPMLNPETHICWQLVIFELQLMWLEQAIIVYSISTRFTYQCPLHFVYSVTSVFCTYNSCIYTFHTFI